MIFVETPVFTCQLKKLLTDEEYSALQRFLIAKPLAGSGLLIYRKGVQDDLTPAQLKVLRTIKDRWS